MYRILTNTFINTYRSKRRHPEETELEDGEDFYLFSTAWVASRPPRPAERRDEVLDSFTDDRGSNRRSIAPGAFRMAVLLPMWRASPTRRSPKSWKFRSDRHEPPPSGRRGLQKALAPIWYPGDSCR